jgi:deoxyribonuclease-4
MFGSHLSIAGGLQKALLSAEALGLDTVQVFTASPRNSGATLQTVFAKDQKDDPKVAKARMNNALGNKLIFTENQQQWKCKPLDTAAVQLWETERDRLKFKHTVSHDSYLINLASADDALWNKSVDLFVEELTRCSILGIPYLVTHPGAHLGTGEGAGLKRVAKAMDAIHGRVPKGVITCLEITAGQGSSLGYKLEHLATIIETTRQSDRLGVCLDTAHLFAAGYDFRGRRYAKFRKQLDSTVGVDRVKVLHLNDSKKELGSRVDRHEHIGHGKIGVTGFQPFVRDKAFKRIPKILETAKEKHADGREWDAVNLELLKSLM